MTGPGAGRGRRSPSRARAFVRALAFALAAAPSAAALADVNVEAGVGHGGVWIADAATPVDVRLRNDGAEPVATRVSIALGGMAGTQTFRIVREVLLAAGASRLETFLVPGPSTMQPDVTLVVETARRVPIRTRTKTGDRGRLEIELGGLQRSWQSFQQSTHRPVGVLGDPRSVIAARLSGIRVREEKKVIGADLAYGLLDVQAESLRLAPLSLDGFEALVVCDPDAVFCSSEAELDGLLDWVAMGGRLYLSLGEHAGAFSASPLAARLPVRWSGAERGEYSELVRELASNPAVALPEVGRPGPFARLDAADGNGPLDERRRTVEFGDGRIVVLGFDLRAAFEYLPPGEDELRRAARAVFGVPPDPWPAVVDQWNPEMDVADSVGRALQAEAFRPPPLAAVLLGLVAYVLVVGPLDWIVLKRLRKERWTTLTFAGAVLVFTVVAYGASLLLFSSEAVTNRVTFVRLSPGGRDGRELMSIQDLAGFYAPTGGTRELVLPLPGAVLGENLPGLAAAGGVGASLPIEVGGNDPLAPRSVFEVAFRSQRVVRSRMAGPTGRTLDARVPEGSPDEVEITSTLPMDLLDAWVLRAGGTMAHVGFVPAGGSARGTWTPFDRGGAAPFPGEVRAFVTTDPATVRGFLAYLVTSAMTSDEQPAGYEALRRSGVVADVPARGRALVVGVADRPPVPLPGGDMPGRTHVVVVKEVLLP